MSDPAALPAVTIYVDGDACPVREETYRVAARLGVSVVVVSNGSRPIRPPNLPVVRMVVVPCCGAEKEKCETRRTTARGLAGGKPCRSRAAADRRVERSS